MEIAKSQHLSGLTVLFIGKLAGLNKVDARDAVLKAGGRVSNQGASPTNLVVLGAAGWPLKVDGHLPKELTAAARRKSSGENIEIIGEEAFIKRLGSQALPSDISQLYTTQQLARILKLPSAQISSWVRKGLVQPVKQKHRLAWFNFQEVARMRLIARLLDNGVELEQIATSLERLAQWLPDAATVLQRMEAYQGRLSIRTEEGFLAAPTGQMHLDFAATDQSQDEEQKLQVIRNLRSARPKDVPIDLLKMPGAQPEAPELELTSSQPQEISKSTQAQPQPEPQPKEPVPSPPPKLLPRRGRVIRFPKATNDTDKDTSETQPEAILPSNVKRLKFTDSNTIAKNRVDDLQSTNSTKEYDVLVESKDAEYWFQTATQLEETGRFTEAVEAYQNAVALPEAPPEAHFNLGNAYYLLGRRGAAAHQFLMAVELDGNYIESWNNLGNTLCELGHPTEGVIAFEKALEIEPHYADAHYNAGHTYAQLGLYEKATGHLRTYIKLDPNSPVAFEVAGTLRDWEREE